MREKSRIVAYMVDSHGADWQRLADYLEVEMERHGWNTQREFAEAAGVGARMIYELLSARPRARMPNKMRKIELAIDWEPGTARRIVYEGYRPQPGREPDPDPWVEETLQMVEDQVDTETLEQIRARLRKREFPSLSDATYNRALAHLAEVATEEEWSELMRRREKTVQQQEISRYRKRTGTDSQ